MSDSWLKLAGNFLIEADKYIQYLNEQQSKTEPVRSEEPKKTDSVGDLGSGICRWCHKNIYLAMSSVLHGDPRWIHADNKDSHCGTFATPLG